MTKEIDFDEDDNEVITDELTLLKERATQMGIQFHPAIGVEKLRARIAEELSGSEAGTKTDVTKEDAPEEPPKEKTPEKETPDAPVATGPKVKIPTKNELIRKHHSQLRRDANKLVRIRVTCMNPSKKNWSGEIMSVSNAIIGTIKKFVPFHLEEGYHVPNVIYRMLKEREYLHITSTKDPKGRPVQNKKLLKEFAIEVMDPLTKVELKDLADRQIANHSIQ